MPTETETDTEQARSSAAHGSPPEELKWLIYDVEWLLEQRNKITVSRNREVIKRALDFLKHVEANDQDQP